ncbi:MAG TPA: hypothetical protein VHL30_00985 [Chlamydiales bacterium]|jgi:hypothetical protein|nr:hypothetical protein [Chlamydiales bacterium]
MINEKISSRRIAKESDRIKRARKKLLARWNEEEKWMSPEAIDEIKEKIKNQYHRNTAIRTRIEGSSKPLRLFAQGEGVERTAGPKVTAVMDRVKKEFQQNKEAMERLLSGGCK